MMPSILPHCNRDETHPKNRYFEYDSEEEHIDDEKVIRSCFPPRLMNFFMPFLDDDDNDDNTTAFPKVESATSTIISGRKCICTPIAFPPNTKNHNAKVLQKWYKRLHCSKNAISPRSKVIPTGSSLENIGFPQDDYTSYTSSDDQKETDSIYFCSPGGHQLCCGNDYLNDFVQISASPSTKIPRTVGSIANNRRNKKDYKIELNDGKSINTCGCWFCYCNDNSLLFVNDKNNCSSSCYSSSTKKKAVRWADEYTGNLLINKASDGSNESRKYSHHCRHSINTDSANDANSFIRVRIEL
jgi:hypothetical protein